jgi:integrase/recombinase XerD
MAGKTYYCLLGLLSVTGLRISEALHLRYEDVDLAEGILVVRGTKFGKSRFVPIHPSTQRVLCDYAAHRAQLLAGRPAPFFFISRRGTRLEPSRVRRTFYTLSQRTGLRALGASHGPRLHWYRSGQDAERRLPILSTYLGHVHLSDTYWYLTSCPELMGLAVKRLEEHWEKPI